MSLAFARAYLQDGCTFWDQVTIKELGSSMMRKLEIGVSRNMNLSGIVTMILGAMYVGAMAMAVFLILVQYTSREGMPCTFPPLFRVELGVLGLFWDFWAKSVSELQLEVEQNLTFLRKKSMMVFCCLKAPRMEVMKLMRNCFVLWGIELIEVVW